MKYVNSRTLKKIISLKKQERNEWLLNHSPFHVKEIKFDANLLADMSIAMSFRGMDVYCANADVAFDILHSWYKRRPHVGEVYVVSNNFDGTCASVLEAMEFILNHIM